MSPFPPPTLPLDRPWEIIPDSTSLVCVTNLQTHIAIYENTLDGRWDSGLTSLASGNASVGISVSGSSYGVDVVRNTVAQTRIGLRFGGGDSKVANYLDPMTGCLFASDNISNVESGVYLAGSTWFIGQISMAGNVVRNTTIDSATYAVFFSGDVEGLGYPDYLDARPEYLNVIEGTYATAVHIGVNFDPGATTFTYSLLYNNSFTGDKDAPGADNPTSFAVDWDDNLPYNTIGFGTLWEGATLNNRFLNFEKLDPLV